MGYVILVQADEGLCQFVLPAINNADYEIVLERKILGLEKSISVAMQVFNHVWSFPKRSEYLIRKENAIYFGEPFRDGDFLQLYTKQQKIIYMVILQANESSCFFQKYQVSEMQQISFGAASDCSVVYRMKNMISRKHAVLYREGSQWRLENKSRNGTFVNGLRMKKDCYLANGDFFCIYGLKVVVFFNVLAVCPVVGEMTVSSDLKPLQERHLIWRKKLPPTEKEKHFFSRSPREAEALFSDSIEIEAAPAWHVSKKKPLFLQIGPSFTMALPMLLGCGMAFAGGGGILRLTGVVTAVSSAMIGVFWALANIRHQKAEEEEEEQKRYNAYGQYLINRAQYIKEKYEGNMEILNRRYQSAEICCTYHEKTMELWNRNPSHKDFLFVRLGRGSIPFQSPIVIPKEKFSMTEDELSAKPAALKNEYSMLHYVPVGVDLLEKRLIGLIGGRRKAGAILAARNIIAQLAVNNCYTEVKFVFIYDQEEYLAKEIWEFAKWLPHVWSEDHKTRLIARNKSDMGEISYELTKVFRMREEQGYGAKKNSGIPHYVVFVANKELLDGELLEKYLFDPKECYGVSTLVLVEKYEQLPNACEDIIEYDREETAIYNVQFHRESRQEVQFDQLHPEELGKLARRLSNIQVQETESGGEIPATLDFLEMYQVHSMEELNVVERWTKNRTYESMRVPIGKKSGNADCCLDIHEKYHGPHGLVAGTTGSGKSETLQTYILSLAVNFSPDDVAFFIIDFKGGGMANLFSNLPHMAGQISNLSGNQVQRAMISIKSENMRRQRIFNEHSVNNINLYTRLYKNNEAKEPVPHLLIIIDEFAELKREEPEFMKELISVAQVGRSLGVHLILATQKPNGTVDDNIRSNSKFRLCLRVQDRQDSQDMLQKPDAAYITQAGRGYLQVGNDEIYELFQSGYSGAAYDSSQELRKSNIATMLTITGKAALVGNRTRKLLKERQKREWLEQLAAIMIQCAKKRQKTVCEIQEDYTMQEAFVQDVFDQIAGKGLDFEENQYNMLRLQDFISLWPKDPKVTDVVGFICRQANARQKKLPELKEKTQLDALVEYLGIVAAKQGFQKQMQLWLPVLPAQLFLQQITEYTSRVYHQGQWEKNESGTLSAVVGMYDDPVNQAQHALVLDFAENGHHAICGTVVSGKSTFLQTMIYSLIHHYSPEEINLYVLDFSSRMLACYEEAPHVGGVLYDSDMDRLDKFFHMLERIMNERKELFHGGNFSQYIRVHGNVIPAVFVIIDNFANFKEKTENKYESLLIRLSREGVGYGIYMTLTSAGFGLAEIQSRIGDNIKTVVSLEMGDKFKFADVLRTVRVPILPESDIRGRGLAYVGGSILEFQTALACEAADDFGRGEAIAAECRTMAEKWKKAFARKIPQIPDKPVLEEFLLLPECQSMCEKENMLPLGYAMKDASVYGIDLSRTYCYCINGMAGCGKTNALKVLIQSAYQKKGEITVIDLSGSELCQQAKNTGARYVTDWQQMFDFFKELMPAFAARNKQKQKLVQKGLDKEEIYREMQQYRPSFIFIGDMEAFIQTAYQVSESGSSMYKFIENIMEKGSLHNYYFIAVHHLDKVGTILGRGIYNSMLSYRTGLHLGGNLNGQRMFSFTNISSLNRGKLMKPGLALVPAKEDETLAETVVIPLAKGV